MFIIESNWIYNFSINNEIVLYPFQMLFDCLSIKCSNTWLFILDLFKFQSSFFLRICLQIIDEELNKICISNSASIVYCISYLWNIKKFKKKLLYLLLILVIFNVYLYNTRNPHFILIILYLLLYKLLYKYRMTIEYKSIFHLTNL